MSVKVTSEFRDFSELWVVWGNPLKLTSVSGSLTLQLAQTHSIEIRRDENQS